MNRDRITVLPRREIGAGGNDGDDADWLDGAHGAEVWAQTLGSIEAATMLLSGQDARSAARMVAHHERGTYLVARMKAAKAA